MNRETYETMTESYFYEILSEKNHNDFMKKYSSDLNNPCLYLKEIFASQCLYL